MNGSESTPGQARSDIQWTTVQCALQPEQEHERLYIVFQGGAAIQQFRLKC